ncbi:hypothetical protein [Granulicella arctica]|uniref:hypothetical protein n=1 Tax=Granulicella arctica TaxID=940613 RepID=UPI0021DFC43D|nr:hypothetical protein [Granulicella arctica]
MRSTAWIWFLGCAAWLFDGAVNVHYQSWLHARIAFTIALLFLAAALYYRSQSR